jgi:hypothetical protein
MKGKEGVKGGMNEKTQQLTISGRCITRIREKYERRVTEIIEFVSNWLAPEFPAEGTRERAILEQLCLVAFESMKNETAAYVVSEMKAQGCSNESAEEFGKDLLNNFVRWQAAQNERSRRILDS